MRSAKDFQEVNRYFSEIMEPLEADSRNRAHDAFRVEQRPAPAWARWIGTNVLPPGHIALQGDFDHQHDTPQP